MKLISIITLATFFGVGISENKKPSTSPTIRKSNVEDIILYENNRPARLQEVPFKNTDSPKPQWIRA